MRTKLAIMTPLVVLAAVATSVLVATAARGKTTIHVVMPVNEPGSRPSTS